MKQILVSLLLLVFLLGDSATNIENKNSTNTVPQSTTKITISTDTPQLLRATPSSTPNMILKIKNPEVV